MSHVHTFLSIHTLYSIHFVIFLPLGTFLIVSFSLSLFFVCVSLLLWHLNTNLLHLETLLVLGHPPFLILLPLTFGSMMRRPNRTSLRTFPDEAFILIAKSSCRTSLTLTYSLSFTVGVGSHCVTSWSLVYLCWSRSFTSTCMDLIFQYLFLLFAFEVRALWS